MYQTLNQEGLARWAEFQCLGSSIPAENDGVRLGTELPSRTLVPPQEEQSSVILGQV